MNFVLNRFFPLEFNPEPMPEPGVVGIDGWWLFSAAGADKPELSARSMWGADG